MSKIATIINWYKVEKGWLDIFEDPAATWVMLESLVSQEFKTLEKLRDEVLRDPPWGKGVVFSEDHMLKWRKRHGKNHAILVTDKDGISLPAGMTKLPDVTLDAIIGEKSAVLWGKSEKGIGGFIFFEDRVPIELCYPVQPEKEEKRAFLIYKRYELKVKNLLASETIDFLLPGAIHRWCGVECEP